MGKWPAHAREKKIGAAGPGRERDQLHASAYRICPAKDHFVHISHVSGEWMNAYEIQQKTNQKPPSPPRLLVQT
jgi:hypothetical protein